MRRLIVILCAALGFGSLLFPAASAWFATRDHQEQLSDYFTIVENTDQEVINEQITAATEYNRKLAAGTQPILTSSELDLDYQELLTVPGKSMIGQVSVPRLGIELPIYHGTSDETLRIGVGHLYGTSLPVGGPSSHAALTAHSGMSSGTGFDALQHAKNGDLIEVRVLGQVAVYRVDDISVVEPTDVSKLQITTGEDLLTLITCTPIGINSHRLLVTGRRIATSPENVQMAALSPARQPPWWLFIWLFSVAATSWLTAVLGKGKREDMRYKIIHPITAIFALALAFLPAPVARSEPVDNPEPSSGSLYVHRFTESVALTRDGTLQETTAQPAENIRFILEPVEFDETAQANETPDSTKPVGQASGQSGITEIQIRSLRTIGPAREATTDKSGVATFSEIPLGTYRVREDGSAAVRSQAFLVQLPMPHPSKAGEWLYEVHAYPKLTDTSVSVNPPNRLTRTGPTAVLIVGALGCLVAANLSIIRLRKKEH